MAQSTSGNIDAVARLVGVSRSTVTRVINDEPHVSAFTEAAGFEAMQMLLPRQPNAIFVANDVMAIGALRAIQAAGLRVLEDVAMVGFDRIAETTSPPPTSVHQPLEQLGSRTVKLLPNQIEGKASRTVREILQATLGDP